MDKQQLMRNHFCRGVLTSTEMLSANSKQPYAGNSFVNIFRMHAL
jgi:hypothetical protein